MIAAEKVATEEAARKKAEEERIRIIPTLRPPLPADFGDFGLETRGGSET